MALLLHPKSLIMKKKILIVDNNSNLLEVLELLLKNSYDTISTLNRTQAVDMASEQIPDLILNTTRYRTPDNGRTRNCPYDS